MSRFSNPIAGISGVAAGQTATVPLKNNRRIHALNLFYSNAASRTGNRQATKAEIEADITEVRLVSNGKTLRKFSPAQNNIINALNGIAAVAGVLSHFFSHPKRRTPDGEEWSALTAYGLPDLKLEVDLAAAADGPQLSAEDVYDFEPDRNKGFILWERRSVDNPAVGDRDITDLTKTGAYSRIHLFTDKVSRVQVEVDDTKVIDRDALKNSALLGAYGLSVQSGTFPVVFDFTQQITDVLDMRRKLIGADGKVLEVDVQNLLLRITHTAGVANYAYISERLVKNVAGFIA